MESNDQPSSSSSQDDEKDQETEQREAKSSDKVKFIFGSNLGLRATNISSHHTSNPFKDQADKVPSTTMSAKLFSKCANKFSAFASSTQDSKQQNPSQSGDSSSKINITSSNLFQALASKIQAAPIKKTELPSSTTSQLDDSSSSEKGNDESDSISDLQSGQVTTFQPCRPILEEKKLVTGEECENNLIDVTGKLYIYDKTSASWRELGKSTLRVNESKENENENDTAYSTRLITRTEATQVLSVNSQIWEGMVAQKAGRSAVRFSATNMEGQMRSFLFKCQQTQDQNKLLIILEKQISKIKKLKKLQDDTSKLALNSHSNGSPESTSDKCKSTNNSTSIPTTHLNSDESEKEEVSSSAPVSTSDASDTPKTEEVRIEEPNSTLEKSTNNNSRNHNSDSISSNQSENSTKSKESPLPSPTNKKIKLEQPSIQIYEYTSQFLTLDTQTSIQTHYDYIPLASDVFSHFSPFILR